MHTTALCSPTRTCILTGRNHHSNAMACITEGSTGYPGANGNIPFENGFLSEMLLQQGYNTYAIGKWHLTPADQISAAGPYDRWPLGRGFERYYGFLGAETDQWYPDLVYDNHNITPPATPEEGYHLTEDLVDRAIAFLAGTHPHFRSERALEFLRGTDIKLGGNFEWRLKAALEEAGLETAVVTGMAAATFGLVAGGLGGRPADSGFSNSHVPTLLSSSRSENRRPASGNSSTSW